MTRSGDGGISRQRQRRKERTERCDWLQPAEKPDAQGRTREGGKKRFRTEMWRTGASRDQSCQYVETRYRFDGGHLPRCSVERAQV
jgi:hypothetical protein